MGSIVLQLLFYKDDWNFKQSTKADTPLNKEANPN